jgi:putative ABC transport system permease protein
MLRTYFLIAIRNLFKNKLSSLINIIGLSVSITLVIHLTLFVLNELSYDRFHEKHDRIFRVLSEFTPPGENTSTLAICQGQLPLVINGTIPEVESTVRIFDRDYSTIEYNDKRFADNHFIHVDSTFFDVFSFKLLSGSPHSDLSVKENLFISRKLALKVFGSIDIVGKMIKISNRNFNVMGVFENVPQNSHLQFDMVGGISEVESLVYHSGLEFLNYVLLKENIDQEAALKKICRKYDELTKVFFKNDNIICLGRTQALTNIWLHSNNIKYDVVHGNINDIYIAGVLIVFVLLIAIVNFINLMVVKAEERAKEIAIRKMAGARIGSIQRQFMGETFLVIVISVLLAIIFVEISQPLFNSITGKVLSFSGSFSLKLLLVLIMLSIIFSIICGAYPALYLSGFPVTRIFKGNSPKGKNSSPLSKFLVFIQFSIVIFLISSLLVFYLQMDFIKNSDLGFDNEQVVDVTDQNGGIYKSFQTIKQILLQDPKILNVSFAQGITAREMSGQYAGKIDNAEGKQYPVRHDRIDHDFIKTFRMKLIEGRDFNIGMPTDKRAFIINETAKKELNLPPNAVGLRLVMNEDTGELIGVVKDFHFASLHDKIEPLFMTLTQPNWGHFYIRIQPGSIHESLNYIRKTMQYVDPHYLFEYEFVDDYFNKQYNSDEKIHKMVFYASILCILIALVGLIALTSVTTAKRTKEIGVRKVFGAFISNIIGLLLNDILKWVLLANIIAWPSAYFVMHKWLEGFAYRIHFPFLILLLSGTLATLIAALAIIFEVIKNARRNPVTSLRYE